MYKNKEGCRNDQNGLPVSLTSPLLGAKPTKLSESRATDNTLKSYLTNFNQNWRKRKSEIKLMKTTPTTMYKTPQLLKYS